MGHIGGKDESHNARIPVSRKKTILGSYNIKNFKETALNLIDGIKDNTALTWNFNNNGASNPTNWMVLDLEKTYNIRRFVIYDSRTYGVTDNISGYRIYVSDEAPTDDEMATFHKTTGGAKWTKVTAVTSDDSNIKTYEPDVPVTARYVKLEIPYSCVTDSAQLYEFEVYGEPVSTGISDVNDDDGISVYPNVVDRGDDINVIAPSGSTYMICNLGGSVVGRGNTGNGRISTSAMPSGIYIITVKSEAENKCEKIVVR